MNCEYRVGQSLSFELAGVGQDDVVFTVYKADFDGDYYASFPLASKVHDCAIVKPGGKTLAVRPAFELAFISPRTGRVFRTWQECRGH